MKPAQKTVIAGLTYMVTPVGAGEGLRVAARLASLVAPVMRAGGGTPQEIGAKALGSLLENPALADHLEFLCATFAARTQVTRPAAGNAPAFAAMLNTCFDEHFAGDYGSLLEWLAFALEVNMSSFFAVSPALRAKIAARIGAQNSAAPSPAVTTG